MIRCRVFTAMALTCAASVCMGHGITAARVDGGVGIRAAYDDGTPVTFSDVSVFSPAAAGKPALTGATDRNGCFMFRPDTNGVWKVTVDDGMGHAVTRELALDGPAAAPAEGSGRMSKVQGVVTGMAMIFAVFGWLAFLRLKLATGH